VNIYEEALAEHYRRIRTDPIYRLQEQMEDMRVDRIPALWSNPTAEEPEPIITQKHIYFKMDRGAFELNRRVKELENSNKYLVRELGGLMATAPKQRPVYKQYSNE